MKKVFDEENWDWFKFLDLSKKKKLQFQDIADRKAGNWVTCACGQLCDVLPRDESGIPEDEQLRTLGKIFYDSIVDSDFKFAKKLLKRIEKRSLKLIKRKLKEI